MAKNEFGEAIGGTLDGAEEIICPKRGARVVWKVVATILCVMAAGALLRIAGRVLWRAEVKAEANTALPPAPPPPPPDRAWFAQKAAAVEAVDAEVLAAQSALERKQEESKDRFFSRESDRLECDRLNHLVVDLQAKRAALIAEHNGAAASSALSIAPIQTMR